MRSSEVWHRCDFINAARLLKIRTPAIFFRPIKPQNLSTCRSLASSYIFFCQLAVSKHVADDFQKFITNAKWQVVFHHEHCKFCFRIKKFIALFWLSFDFFFRLQCSFYDFRTRRVSLRYSFLLELRYNVFSARITFCVPGIHPPYGFYI